MKLLEDADIPDPSAGMVAEGKVSMVLMGYPHLEVIMKQNSLANSLHSILCK